MGRVIIASIVGGIVFFAWGFAFWPGGINKAFDGLKPLPAEAAVVEGLDLALDETGVYYFPEMPADMSDEVAMEAYAERHQAGPIGKVIYRQEGLPAMSPMVFVKGIAIDVIVAFLVSMITFSVAKNGGGIVCKLVAVWAFAIGAAIASHGMLWNWFYIPTDYTLMMMADVAGGWIIAGFFIALIVRGPKPALAPPAE